MNKDERLTREEKNYLLDRVLEKQGYDQDFSCLIDIGKLQDSRDF